MDNVKAFYRLSKKREEIKDSIEDYDDSIKDISELARKQKKGSIERKELFEKANAIKNSDDYKRLKAQLEVMNFCINTVFYL